jgi:hypothetical protein
MKISSTPHADKHGFSSADHSAGCEANFAAWTPTASFLCEICE